MSGAMGKAFADLSNGLGLSHVWVHQAYHGISAKYKRTVLGSLWISGGMVASSVSMAIVFGGIFGQDLKVALPLIMAGLLTYMMVVFPLSEAPEAFVGNSTIIVNHAYPFTYFIFEAVCKSFFLFLHNLAVFYVMMAFIGSMVVPHWAILPGLLLVFTSMITWSTITAMFAARFRDVRFMFPFLGSLFLVLTPIFWQPSMLSGWRLALVHYNPLYGLLEVIRMPLLGKMPPTEAWMIASVTAALGLVAWLVFFPANRRRIPFWV
ncbi:MAG: ABC transporter permease [Caldilineaceae bacterium]|jgi:ABC-2 type transport system permease protein/lipopolysaccharide transport system permease protein